MTRPASSAPDRRRRQADHLPEDGLAFALLRAAELVAGVRRGQTLTEGLANFQASARGLPASQRAAVQDLAYGTLRRHAFCLHALTPLLRSEPPEPLHSLLLVAIHRLEDRPDSAHTIVDQAVEAAGTILRGRLRALANGVLRSYLRQRDSMHATLARDEEASHQHPGWWIARLRQDHPDHWRDILAAGNTRPPMALRTNRRRIDRTELVARLRDAAIECEPDQAEAILLAAPCPVDQIPGFADGDCSVQDPGAQRAAHWLDLAPGQRVLDACAAPGGKTAHILEIADVSLTALELSAERMRRVEQNLSRLGLSAELRVADCRSVDSWWDGTPFDRILADVPCSASGVVRRHPDIKWLRRDEDIASFARQQGGILDALWQTLAAGGKMLYVTCSVFSEENTHQTESFRRRHPDARPLQIDGQAEQQLLPTAQHDGFFYALFEKAL